MPVVFISFYFIIRCRCCFSEISVQQFCRDSTVYVHMYESAFAYIHTVYSAPSIDCVKGGGGCEKKSLILFCEPHPPPLLISWTKTAFPVGQKSKTSQTYTVINVPDSRIRTVPRTFLFNLSFHKDKKS